MEPDLDTLSPQLDHALGSTTAAINWDLARDTLKAAVGMPTLVGLQADLDTPAAAAPAATPTTPATPSVPPTITMPAPPAAATPPAEQSATTLPAPDAASSPAPPAQQTPSDPRH
jgi:hypothetical protein